MLSHAFHYTPAPILYSRHQPIPGCRAPPRFPTRGAGHRFSALARCASCSPASCPNHATPRRLFATCSGLARRRRPMVQRRRTMRDRLLPMIAICWMIAGPSSCGQGKQACWTLVALIGLPAPIDLPPAQGLNCFSVAKHAPQNSAAMALLARILRAQCAAFSQALPANQTGRRRLP